MTVCTAERREVLGEVRQGQMVLSGLGQIAVDEWTRTLDAREGIVTDVFVVMPNHVHLLLGMVDPPEASGEVVPDEKTRAEDVAPEDTIHGVPTNADSGRASGEVQSIRRFGQHAAGSVSSVVGAYKAAVTRVGRRHGLWWPEGALWQSRFHDRVVRSAPEADRIRQYIANNPARWVSDRFHPSNDAPTP